MTTPLYIVTGTSGSGKSTASKEVRKIMGPGFNIYDMDSIIIDGNFQLTCQNWLRIAYANSLSGNTTILFGAVPLPYNVNLCDHFHYFQPIHYLLLHCNSASRTSRLRERGNWTEQGIQSTNIYAKELYNNYVSSNLPIIDTTNTPVVQVANQIKGWLLLKQKG
ncbi:AAA family ATPase [Paenibacillus sp. M1]|uniref:AAA family ATPase n=1 Tax=Paenibacillus haidiansis TaxID=1574488 RepID=A0ABU7VQC8_9BACL